MSDPPLHPSLRLNQANWDERAPAHAASPDYCYQRMIADPALLSDVVRFDRPRLGDIAGLRGVHLQCHIGTDTLSLARLGATMSGLDFSAASLTEARKLAEATGTAIAYVHGNVYDAPALLGPDCFDFVYTGIGALCWLPKIHPWAEVVAALLKPGGFLFMREGHPVLWAVDESHTDHLVIGYPYFERPEPTVWTGDGTYVQTDATLTATTTHEWNHGLGEIVTALLDAGLELTLLAEHDTVPWDAIPGQMELAPNGEHRLRERPERLPHTYTLKARKRR